MILVTVGTQIPFDRLIALIDNWITESGTKQEVVAQIGDSMYRSVNMTIFKSVEPELFEKYIHDCDFIISHGGMGSILTALRVKKPIVIFPRKASLGEHRNDHQSATVGSFSSVAGIYATHTKEELFELLNSKEKLEPGVLNESDEYKKLKNNLATIIG
jgi:UDP-N-acetylglucosamine transferase subunit ALG13